MEKGSKKRTGIIIGLVIVLVLVATASIYIWKKTHSDAYLAEKAGILNFKDSTVSADIGMIYYLENYVKDTAGNIYSLTASVKEKNGAGVSVNQKLQGFEVTSGDGYIVEYTVAVADAEYTREVTIHTTGISVDTETEYIEKGTTVKLEAGEFVVSSKAKDVSIEVEATYSSVCEMNGYTIQQDEKSFIADICGEYHVTYTATYEGKKFQTVKKYIATQEYEDHIIADFHSPVSSASIGTDITAEYYAEFKGETGAVKVVNNTDTWPRMTFNAIHSIQSYKDAGYKYVVFRMYFPKDETTWPEVRFGAPKGDTVILGEAEQGKWVEYFVSADLFYQYWTDNGPTEGASLWSDEAKDANGNPLIGATFYISEIRMAKEGFLVESTGKEVSVKAIRSAKDASLKDDAVAKAITEELKRTKGAFLSEVKIGANGEEKAYPLFMLPMDFAEMKANYEKTGKGHLLKVRMYMPEGMEWEGVSYGLPRDGETKHAISRIEVKSGEWVDYIFDLSVFFENNTEPYGVICSQKGTQVKDDQCIVYVSGMEFCDGDIALFPTDEKKVEKGTFIEMGIGSEDGWTVKYTSSDEKVATVDKDGNVTVIGAGKAEITVTLTTNGETQKKSCVVYSEGSNALTNGNNAIVESARKAVKEELKTATQVTEIVGNDWWKYLETGIDFDEAKAEYKKDGSNRYLIVRMYTPKTYGWKDVCFGLAKHGEGRYVLSDTSVKEDEWVNYVIDMKAAYESDNPNDFWTIVKPHTELENNDKGQWFTYLSYVGFKEGVVIRNTDETMKDVKVITQLSDMSLSDDKTKEAVKAELESLKGSFISEYTISSDEEVAWPVMLLPLDWDEIKQEYDTYGTARFMKVRMYMPENMAWKEGVNLGHPKDGADYYATSKTEVTGGEWVDYVFDLNSFYNKGTEPWMALISGNGAELQEGKSVIYVSSIKLYGSDPSIFPTEDMKVSKGTYIEMGIGTEKGWTVTYESSNPTVAQVDSKGNVTTVGAGKATITLKLTADGTTKTQNCTVYVEGNNVLEDGSQAVIESAADAVNEELARGETVTEYVGNEWWMCLETGIDFEKVKAEYKKDGSNRYLTVRMYVPNECGWKDVCFGFRPDGDGRFVISDNPVVQGQWTTYVFDMKEAYELDSEKGFWTVLKPDIELENNDRGQWFTYISSIEFKDGITIRNNDDTIDGVKYISKLSDAAVQDEAIAQELEKGRFLAEYTVEADWSIFLFPFDFDAAKANYEKTGEGRYLKVRMYMPSGMKWDDMTFGRGSVCAWRMNGGKEGEWVDCIFDLSEMYKNGTAPWNCIASQGSGVQQKDGKCITYISEISFASNTEAFCHANFWDGDATLLTKDSDGYSQLPKAVQEEIATNGSVAFLRGTYANGKYMNTPFIFPLMKSRYLVMKVYVTEENKKLSWGYSASNATENRHYVNSENELVPGTWTDCVFDLNKLGDWKNDEIWSILNVQGYEDNKQYEMYISDYYFTDANPLDSRESGGGILSLTSRFLKQLFQN